MTDKWEDNDLGRKVIDVLTNVRDFNPNHHFGRPFVTAYQLAILLKERCPDTVARLGYPIGGRGVGPNQETLPRYLANQLSRRIENGELRDTIEGRFLSGEKLTHMKFNDGGEPIFSSATGSHSAVSMFRLRS